MSFREEELGLDSDNYSDNANDSDSEYVFTEDEENSENSSGSDDSDYDVESAEEEEEGEEEDYYVEVYSRPSSTTPAEDEATANAIINSLQNIMPELKTDITPSQLVSRPSMKMTDLGYKISQMVLRRRSIDASALLSNDMDGGEENDGLKDAFLEKALSGRRRNRTGVRGRPKKVDYGFGKSTTHILPPEIARIMGSANICYVSRRYDEAIRLLLEVVRQAPHAFEAYQTLAMIHEEQGDKSKALSYYVIAAHLIRTDADLWRKLAKATLELGRKDEAIYYLGKLVRMRDAKAEYFWTRARIFVEREEYRRAIQGFHKLLLMEAEGDEETFAQVNTLAERLGLGYMTNGLFVQTIEDVIALQRIPSLAVINFVLDLLLIRKEYEQTLILIDKIAIPLVIGTGTNLSTDWYNWGEADRLIAARHALIPEVRLYYIIASIYLKKENLDDIEWTRNLDGNRYGHLLRALGKALLSNMQPVVALNILLPLIDVPAVGDADLGVLIGECYKLIPGQESMAISTFEAVQEICPDRDDVRMSLYDLYQQTRQTELADSIKDRTDLKWEFSGEDSLTYIPRPELSIDEIFEGLFTWDLSYLDATESEGVNLLQVRTGTIKEKPSKRRARRRIRKFTSYSSSQMSAIQHDYRQIIALFDQAQDDEAASFRQIRHISTPLIEDMLGNSALRPTEGIKQLLRTSSLPLLHGLSIDEWFELSCRFIIAESHIGSLERALRLVRLLLTRSIFHMDAKCAIVLRLLYLGIADLLNKPEALLSATRWFLRNWPALPLSSSLILRVVKRCDNEIISGPILRFVQRMAVKRPRVGAVHLISLIFHLYTERYEGALIAGNMLLSIDPHHKIGLLATAVAILHQSFKRTCKNTSQMQLRAFALLNRYEKLASPDEANYNMGRAFHMMGVIDLACKYYRNSLHGKFKQEAAFNLYLISLQNGEYHLARHYISMIVV